MIDGGDDLPASEKYLGDFLLRGAEPVHHVQSQLAGRRVQSLQAEQQTGGRLGVRQHRVLGQLVQLVQPVEDTVHCIAYRTNNLLTKHR